MKARGTYRTPTISALRGMIDHADEVPEYAVRKAHEVEAAAREGLRRTLREGVLHVCGTDAGTPFNPHGNAPRELMYMVAWGMTPLRAMQAGTANGAALLGLDAVGTVEAGKEADLVLYDGNPLEEMALLLTPRLVLRAGDVVAGELTPP
jgi:imidazolonepropionase-like amidohydrolase